MPGEQLTVESAFGHSYTITYEGLSTSIGEGRWRFQWIALFGVERDGEAARQHDRRAPLLRPERAGLVRGRGALHVV